MTQNNAAESIFLKIVVEKRLKFEHLLFRQIVNQSASIGGGGSTAQVHTKQKFSIKKKNVFDIFRVCTYFEAALNDGVDDDAAVTADVTDIGTDDCDDCCCCCNTVGCCGRVAVAAWLRSCV